MWEDKEIQGRFCQWFGDDGFLRPAELSKWLASNIEVIGLAEREAKRAVEDKASSASRKDTDGRGSAQKVEVQISNGTKTARQGKKKA